MNKQLIITYFEEFKHWLNGGKLLYKSKDLDVWFGIGEAVWGLSTSDVRTIIINDEYVEFRKALAEGKTVQMYCKYDGVPPIWDDMTEVIKSIGFVMTKDNYRIKPEEPQFKVGDWVVNKRSKQRIIKKVTSVYNDTVTVGDSTVGINVMLIKDFELWRPKLNEWCWFYDLPHYDMPVLQKFVTTIGDYYIALNDFNSKHTNLESVPSFEKGISDSYNRWKYCEPFLGTLPSTLKN